MTREEIKDAAAILAAILAVPEERQLDALATALAAWCQSSPEAKARLTERLIERSGRG